MAWRQVVKNDTTRIVASSRLEPPDVSGPLFCDPERATNGKSITLCW